MAMLSLVWGLVTFFGMVAGFFPCLVAVNWLNLPLALAGVAISLIALFKGNAGERGAAIAGLTASAIAVVIGVLRLALPNGML